jgi:hypothetical protein
MKPFWIPVLAALGVGFCACRTPSAPPSGDERPPFRPEKDDAVTITGCLQTGGLVGIGSADLVLTTLSSESARPSASRRSPAGTSSGAGSAYILESGDLTELKMHLGQQLEVTGHLNNTVSVAESSIRTGVPMARGSVTNESQAGTRAAAVANAPGAATTGSAVESGATGVAHSPATPGSSTSRTSETTGQASAPSAGGSTRGTPGAPMRRFGASTPGVPTARGSVTNGSTREGSTEAAGTSGATVATAPGGATTGSALGTATSGAAPSAAMTGSGSSRSTGPSYRGSSGSVQILLVDSVRMVSSSCSAR